MNELKLICHYVRPEGEGDWAADYTRIRAVCGAECLLDPEGEPLPPDFDFTLAPDPLQLTDCMPCLEKLAAEGTCLVREKAEERTDE